MNTKNTFAERILNNTAIKHFCKLWSPNLTGSRFMSLCHMVVGSQPGVLKAGWNKLSWAYMCC